MSNRLCQRVAESLFSAGVRQGDGLLVGFSGGRDSVALVSLLQEGGFSELTLLHLDHALRPESGEEAEWCREFARGRGLGVVVERIEVGKNLGTCGGVGLEEAGRNARYGFFAQTAARLKIYDVVLGHHADDQVETFLFRLLRGSGSLGLGGMAPASVRETAEVSLRLLRPMLGVWRSEVDEWVGQKRLSFREDLTNSDLRWSRNRIRHQLLPEMERVMGRPVRAALWRTAELLRAEADWLRASECAGEVTRKWLEVAALRSLPLALRRVRVNHWLLAQGVESVCFDLVEAVARLAVERFPAKINLPGSRYARRRAGKIFVGD